MFSQPDRGHKKEDITCAWQAREFGKTVEKLIPAVVDCINSGELCILTGTLNSVSNHHVHLLKDRLPTSHFEERVRVEGARGRDALSKSMMLEALTWKLMKPAVEQYERRMVPLRKAMIQVLAVEEVGHRIFFEKSIVSLIDEFGNFSTNLMQQHVDVAVQRCNLENMAINKK